MHHESYFLPKLNKLEIDQKYLTMWRDFNWYKDFILSNEVYKEGNIVSISNTMCIDISKTPGVMENIMIKENCSPKEAKTYHSLFIELCNVYAWNYK